MPFRTGFGMRCPMCQERDLDVTDSRPVEDGYAVRRRRCCMTCGHRFTTVERAEAQKPGRRKRAIRLEAV